MTEERLNLRAVWPLLESHASAFAELTNLLRVENEKVNLTRIEAPGAITFRHYLDSLAGIEAARALGLDGKPLRVLDLGSGAGFPVLPLAIGRPDWEFVSVEATWKKCHFQETAASWLGLKNVRVVHGRGEELAGSGEFREGFDLVTARAVAELRMLAELALPLVKVGGVFLAWKGASAREELEAAKQAISVLGGGEARLLRYSLGQAGDVPAGVPVSDFFLAAVRKERATPAKYPRTYGVIKKSPL